MEFPSTKSSKSKVFCSVFGCNSKASRCPQLSFHRFPPSGRKVSTENKLGNVENVDIRKVWERKLKMGKPASKTMVVCSRHFKETDYFQSADQSKKKFLKKNAVPSANLPKGQHPTPEKQRQKQKRTNLLAKRRVFDDENKSEVPEPLVECPNQFVRTEKDMECAEVLCNLSLAAPKNTFRDFQVQVDMEQLRSIADKIDSDSKLSAITGLQNLQMLNTIELLVSKIYLDRKVRRLLLRDRIILTFMKLKNDISYIVLSLLFGGISAQTCRNIFYENISVLATALQSAVYFLDMDTVKAHIPRCFAPFSNVRVVLDCIEIGVQKAKCICCRIKTYSHYKSSNTIKFMTGVSPSGLITFISRMYGGRASDKMIFEQSGIVQKMNKGDTIMVDKGFLIDEICNDHDIKIIRPPFLRNKNQLTPAEAKLNASIARARVHIERSNQRIKVFKMLSNKIHWSLLPKMEDVFLVVSAVVNLSSPIISADKF